MTVSPAFLITLGWNTTSGVYYHKNYDLSLVIRAEGHFGRVNRRVTHLLVLEVDMVLPH